MPLSIVLPDDPITVGILSISALVLLITPFFILRKRKNYKIIISAYILCLVFVMRLSVTLVGEFETVEGLNFPERLLDSLIHAFQTFSMDEDYTSYTAAGKELLEKNYSSWAFVYGLFNSLLNVCAPVIGGALLLDIFIRIFPSLRIAIHPFKHKYIFSELNEMSIALAEDIYRDKNYKVINKKCKFKPLLVFTDSYVDNESEVSSELLAKAKKLGAVCVKTDLLLINFAMSKTVTYLLIDSNVENNITSFSKLVLNKRENDKKKCIFLREIGAKNHLFPIEENEKASSDKKEKETRTRIFVFIQDEHESDTIHRVLNSSDVKELITVRAIKDYMNAAINLMTKVPLFLPLLYTPKNELNITIIGGGSIAEEVFKAIYWCGQMKDIKLNVTVLSENATSMEKHLNEFYAEMMECCEANSANLRLRESEKNSPFNPPYLNYKSFENVKDVTILSSYPKEVLSKTDYYIIALGSDALNHKMTSIISSKLSKLKLESMSGIAADDCPETTVIVPAIFDTDLAASMQVSKPDGSLFESLIIPFATFKERFSCQNVFFTTFMDDALSTQYLYAKKQSGKCANDEYSWMADVVKEVHAPYKLFGLGLIKKSDGNDGELYELDEASETAVTPQQYHELAWLEHRRWNAFMRSQGFSRPDWRVFDRYCEIRNDHKNIPLKLHPCLVESSVTPTACLNITDNCEPSDYVGASYDRLDYVSVRIFRTRRSLDSSRNIPEKNRYSLSSKSGFKAYDYYGAYTKIKVDKELDECIPTGTDIRIPDSLLARKLNEFLKKLGRKQRKVFIRRYRYFDSTENIAELYGINEKLVVSYLLKTRKKLRDILVDNIPTVSSSQVAVLNSTALLKAIEKLDKTLLKEAEVVAGEKRNEWKWDAIDSKLNAILQPQPNNDSSRSYP